MSLQRPWLLPFVPLWWLGATTKNQLYNHHLLPQRQLRRPVISIGSLSAGGAGKTPVVRMLAELLLRKGIGVDVLSRGYGRSSSAAAQVDADGNPALFGDEPLELLRSGLGDELRVFVAADRLAAGALAEHRADKPRLHLLDDGFQHRRLSRDLDIVVLTAAEAHDWLLPAGNLREGLSSLRRAQVIVVREEEAFAVRRALPRSLRAELWHVRRELVLPERRPNRPLAFCAIARPKNFFAMLGLAGCDLAATQSFPDHHAFREPDFDLLLRSAQASGADGFVTTAKDQVRIPSTARRRLEQIGPVMIAELRVTLLDEERAWSTLARVSQR